MKNNTNKKKRLAQQPGTTYAKNHWFNRFHEQTHGIMSSNTTWNYMYVSNTTPMRQGETNSIWWYKQVIWSWCCCLLVRLRHGDIINLHGYGVAIEFVQYNEHLLCNMADYNNSHNTSSSSSPEKELTFICKMSLFVMAWAIRRAKLRFVWNYQRRRKTYHDKKCRSLIISWKKRQILIFYWTTLNNKAEFDGRWSYVRPRGSPYKVSLTELPSTFDQSHGGPENCMPVSLVVQTNSPPSADERFAVLEV
jgi:hypothetical protein